MKISLSIILAKISNEFWDFSLQNFDGGDEILLFYIIKLVGFIFIDLERDRRMICKLMFKSFHVYLRVT